jgi:acyl-CoA synthetase (AMP-forming)/AMP-acid ligase II
MRRIGKITGRSDDMLIIRGVNVFPSQIEELILRQAQAVAALRAGSQRDGHLDSMKVNVELKPQFEFASAAEKEFVAHDLQHHIKSYIGISATYRHRRGRRHRTLDRQGAAGHRQAPELGHRASDDQTGAQRADASRRRPPANRPGTIGPTPAGVPV